MQDVQKTSCTLLWVFFQSGASCQAALHGCLPAEIAAIYSAAQQHTSETNPLREAALSQKKGRVAATRFVSRKNLTTEAYFVCVGAGLYAYFLRPAFCREYRLLALRTARLKGAKPMARVKRGTKRRARRKKYLKRTKGFFLTKSKLYQSAQEAANRADRYAFRDRRVKKRQYRRLWIQRIGAGHARLKRPHLRSTDSRPESRRSRTGPQGACRHSGKRRSGLRAAGRES